MAAIRLKPMLLLLSLAFGCAHARTSLTPSARRARAAISLPRFARKSQSITRCAALPEEARGRRRELVKAGLILGGIGLGAGGVLFEPGYAHSEAIGDVGDYNLDAEQGADNELATFQPKGTQAQAVFEYPKVWKTTETVTAEDGMERNWFKIKEPISTNVVFTNVQIQTSPVKVKSVSEFGRPESDKYLKIVAGDDIELQQADLMGAEIREVDGQKYYDYKLAYSPKSCSDADRRLAWGTCPIKTLAYVSTTVADGVLFKFIARTNLVEWNNFAKQQPAVWRSFRVNTGNSGDVA